MVLCVCIFAFLCVCVCVGAPSHEYSVSSAAAVTMTELMTVTDVEIAPPLRVRASGCVFLRARLSGNTSIYQINYTANIINISTFQGAAPSPQK